MGAILAGFVAQDLTPDQMLETSIKQIRNDMLDPFFQC